MSKGLVQLSNNELYLLWNYIIHNVKVVSLNKYRIKDNLEKLVVRAVRLS